MATTTNPAAVETPGVPLAMGTTQSQPVTVALPKKKLHGRAFYESIGSPRYIIAPMVDASEFVSLPRPRLELPYPD